MMSNSPCPRSSPLATAGALARKVFGPRLMAELIEDAVDHFRLLALEKGVRKIDILGNHHARRHVLAHQHLVGAGTQNGAQNRVDAIEPPALREMTVDERIDAALLAHHAFHDVTEELELRVAILATFDFLT